MKATFVLFTLFVLAMSLNSIHGGFLIQGDTATERLIKSMTFDINPIMFNWLYFFYIQKVGEIKDQLSLISAIFCLVHDATA